MKINVKGAIISNDDKWVYDLFDMEATCPNDVVNALDSASGDVEIIINSGGGDVYSGSEIYTLLRSYQGKVNVKVVGIAASAASVIAMAGDNVEISPTAQIMIHNAQMVARGDDVGFLKASNILSGTNKSIASAYISKTGLSENEILELMREETWLTADEAIEKGFADNKMFADSAPKFVASTNNMLSNNAINKVTALMNRTPEVKIDVDVIANKVLEKINNEKQEKESIQPQKNEGLKRFFF